MTTTHAIVSVSLFLCSTSAVAISVADTQPSGQDWTILSLLAAVVLGIGGRMVLALDKNTAATTQAAAALGKMVDDTTRVERAIDAVPAKVADELERRRIAKTQP